MRPALVFSIFLSLLLALDGALLLDGMSRRNDENATLAQLEVLTSGLGLTDLAVSTEARYTRHPAVSDPMAPFMDHPGAIEHFPTGAFWLPVR
ncbi:hypothetical protein [Thiovibrio frasassiensis]|uniref:Uncharacterized protein n=1 Tax=Thiovibrio frasassiensis TaxID=2984131 RepID=A0A9X4RMY6_9BACT|nr:hypothetical protein [Thiovibrio frasassiensis]MDG4476720.1 hypothetical protein [Thiovibrio frasassiensis]